MSRFRFPPALSAVLGLVVLLGLAGPAHGQWEEAIWTASDLDQFDEFGRAVDVDGDVAAVGAWRAGAGGSGGGKVYLSRKGASGWVEEQILTSPNSINGGQFGHDVAVRGNTLVVGASGEQKAYVYEYDGATWSHVATLTVPGTVFAVWFGVTVDIDDTATTIAVGDYSAGYGGMLAGVVIVYEQPPGGWVTTSSGTILAPSDNSVSTFGLAMDMNGVGDVIAVGHRGSNVGTSGEGVVRVFEKPLTGWVDSTEDAILVASAPTVNASLGEFGIHVDGDTVAAGAPLAEDSLAVQTGAVYVFDEPAAGWTGTVTETQKLTASNGGFHHRFGDAVAFEEGRRMVVGASNKNDGLHDGTAYLFEWNGGSWVEVAELQPSDFGGRYGMSVALQGGLALIGAPEASVPLEGLCGKTYEWILDGFELTSNLAVVNAGDTLTLTATGGEPGGLMFLFLVAVDGVPLVMPLLADAYDACGRWTISTVWGGGGPVGLTLMVIGQDGASGGAPGVSTTINVLLN